MSSLEPSQWNDGLTLIANIVIACWAYMLCCEAAGKLFEKKIENKRLFNALYLLGPVSLVATLAAIAVFVALVIVFLPLMLIIERVTGMEFFDWLGATWKRIRKQDDPGAEEPQRFRVSDGEFITHEQWRTRVQARHLEDERYRQVERQHSQSSLSFDEIARELRRITTQANGEDHDEQ